MRNFVAKYAQKSGAGKHQSKKGRDKMSYVGQEDWVHIDDHNKEIERLEARVSDLEQVIRDLEYDERFILSLIMGLRGKASVLKYWEIVGGIDNIIGFHSAVSIVEAKAMLNKEKP
jgi:hypothetical protein